MPKTRRRTSCPSPGVLTEFRLPHGEGIRIDTGYREGNKVTPFYDPMIMKVVATPDARASHRPLA
jgi:acetyl-CoA carboxylase biotin carboxylase subunit